MPTPDDDEVAEFLEADEPAPKPDRSSPGKEPAWRAKLRSSNFGQAAVVLVTAFAIAVAAWWVVKPEEQDRVRAGTEAVSQVEVAGVQQPPAAGDSAPGFTATDIDFAGGAARQTGVAGVHGHLVHGLPHGDPGHPGCRRIPGGCGPGRRDLRRREPEHGERLLETRRKRLSGGRGPGPADLCGLRNHGGAYALLHRRRGRGAATARRGPEPRRDDPGHPKRDVLLGPVAKPCSAGVPGLR